MPVLMHAIERNLIHMKRALIIGGGPAGLTAAYELLKGSKAKNPPEEIEVIVLEESGLLGGISKTVNYNGNRMDMGGHRFFSKDPKVNAWWKEMLPPQGAPAYDDIVLQRTPPLAAGGPDPEKTDRVMLTRNRVSRIYFDKKFFDYPISLKWETFKNMGFLTTMQAGLSYLASVLHKRQENSLEDFYINRFGKKLYSMFFEKYTENLWGRSPKLGPGELWDVTGAEIEKLGGQILRGCRVTKLHKDEKNHITSLTYEKDGKEFTMEGDIFISSMPVKDLVGGMNGVPEKEAAIAAGLPYRDYMTLGVLVPRLNLENKTKIRTISNIVPDDWIYVHDRTVQMGRFQIYNNWSPYMVKDLEHTVWVGLEYFCNEGDSLWQMSEKEFSDFAVKEMVKMGLIDSPSQVMDTHMEKVKKAYPAYFDTYKDIDELRAYLDTIDNLYCVGRNGQHRYNNIDHSMVTSFETVHNILNGVRDRSNIWNVNTDKEYLESTANQN